MSASLVGSEMCIRDSPRSAQSFAFGAREAGLFGCFAGLVTSKGRLPLQTCLLYTSDAADDM
eukprot:4420239-Alexandrium_andersonii.AAC.1